VVGVPSVVFRGFGWCGGDVFNARGHCEVVGVQGKMRRWWRGVVSSWNKGLAIGEKSG